MKTVENFVSVSKLLDAIDRSRLDNPHDDPRMKASHDQEHQHFYRLVQDAATDLEIDKLSLQKGDIIRLSVSNNEADFHEVKVFAETIRKKYEDLDPLVILTTSNWDINTMSLSETEFLLDKLNSHLEEIKKHDESCESKDE